MSLSLFSLSWFLNENGSNESSKFVDLLVDDDPPHGSLLTVLDFCTLSLSPQASNTAKGSFVILGKSSEGGFFSFRRVEVFDAVPNASCTFAVNGSKLFSTKGSAPSISKGSPYL